MKPQVTRVENKRTTLTELDAGFIPFLAPILAALDSFAACRI